MNKLCSFALTLALLWGSAFPSLAQLARLGQAVRLADKLPATTLRVTRIPKLARYTPTTGLLIRTDLLPPAFQIPKAPAGSTSLSSRVRTQVLSQASEIDLTQLELTVGDAIHIADNICQRGNQLHFLGNLPYLWVERGASRTTAQQAKAVAHYRRSLASFLDGSIQARYPDTFKGLVPWSFETAIVSNLGFFGEKTDAVQILEVYKKAPAEVRAYTEVVAGRALLSLEAERELEELAALSAGEGELLGEFWAGVKELKPELRLPAVKEGSRLPRMPKDTQKLLTKRNPLNQIHTNFTKEGTEMWLALKENAGPVIEEIPAPKPETPAVKPATPGADPVSPVTKPETPVTPAPVTPAPVTPASVTPADSPFTPPANFASGLFKGSEEDSGSILGTFAAIKNISITNPFQTIQALLPYRDELVKALQTNQADILAKGIKGGLDESRRHKLQTAFPPADPSSKEVISLEGAEKIADTVLALADPAFAQNFLQYAPDGYIFLTYDDEKNFYLATETVLPPSHTITPEDIFATSDPNIGITTRTPDEISKTIQKDRVALFSEEGKKIPVLFKDLSDFIKTHPSARYIGIKAVQERVIQIPAGPKTLTDYLPETSPELKELDNFLRNPDALNQAVVLKENSALDNLLELENEIKKMEQDIRSMHADSPDIRMTIRIGKHEITKGVRDVPRSNMHAHVEVYLPEQSVGISYVLPVRISEAHRLEFLTQYQAWREAGEPGESFIKYYKSLLTGTTPPVSVSASESVSEKSFIDYLESYEGFPSAVGY